MDEKRKSRLRTDRVVHLTREELGRGLEDEFHPTDAGRLLEEFLDATFPQLDEGEELVLAGVLIAIAEKRLIKHTDSEAAANTLEFAAAYCREKGSPNG